MSNGNSRSGTYYLGLRVTRYADGPWQIDVDYRVPGHTIRTLEPLASGDNGTPLSPGDYVLVLTRMKAHLDAAIALMVEPF